MAKLSSAALINAFMSPPRLHLPEVWGGSMLENGSSFLPRAFPAQFPLCLGFGSDHSMERSRGVKVWAAKGKGFGELVKKSKGQAVGEKPAAPKICSCGGGEELKEYGACCGPYHGGVVEPDALSLMKARFSAYTRSVVPYIVKTTHPDNPDFQGAEKLAEDVRATCARLRFVRLDILDYEELSEYKASVSFVAHYTTVNGTRKGDKKQLKEKSLFVKEDGRWLYRETISLSQASDAAWMKATTSDIMESEFSGKSFARSKPQPTIVLP